MATYKGKIIKLENFDYIIGNQIGSGGNGLVFSAKIIDNEEHEYAIKFLNIDKADTFYAQKSRRFISELELCKESDHPNIIKILDSGEFEDKLCYVMPKYEKTMSTIIQEDINFLEKLKIAIRLSEAIKYIHDRQVIHRDIKPENILLDDQYNVVLTDFGIAHFAELKITKPKDWLGNKMYSAPEQLIKGNSLNVTAACDIYALGAIINELFTKEKPSGSKFLTISDVEPILSSLDNVVYRCMLQNPLERPLIDEILLELNLIAGDFENNVTAISDKIHTNVSTPSDTKNKIIEIACKDIISADNIFKCVSIDELEKYDTNYHGNIIYDVSDFIKKIYFQNYIYSICLHKFNYESNVYATGRTYTPLNLDSTEEKVLYEQFKALLDKYHLKDSLHDITGRILKTFASCCDYHCKEIILQIPRIEEYTNDLSKSPILYIVYKLRHVLSECDINNISLIEHLSINWINTYYSTQDNSNLYVYQTEVEREKNILFEFEKKWNAISSKISSKYYSIKFATFSDYENFKEYALSLAKPHYIFEGDVLKVVRIKREHNGIVELEYIDSFDITNTFAKILGLRDDY